ncbi:MAG: quinone-dependent dihydroorotate dehydrogenase [Sphingomonas sp.]|uniref:quinone-dependent dihydroorotate dehydrogenase n=1 Tax=Sphingomonas sp. TaxID=28214 RepID=UPI0025F1E16C|nr:quinone-dependent dihydroorotate dehydrogenase [Sphingomonas sp.]MBX9881687.1 quinone-dependent dihydroorotate dehydrogenase [Sphingomonas sp.]
MFAALRPALFALEPERAHRLTIKALAAWGTLGTPGKAPTPDPSLAVTLAGLSFPSPLGLAAGVDKDAEAIAGFFALGFGSVEVGTLTPLPQAGNPRPRLFRLVEDEGVINRMGFNNGGLPAALRRVPGRRRGVLGINVGANKNSPDRTADYARGVAAAVPYADYITINISSPNTPGLRDLQSGSALTELLAACAEARGSTPLFLKIAPDLDAPGIDHAVRAAIEHGVAALIVGNTTLSRPSLAAPAANEAGGLSGAPLKALARQKLLEARAASGGQLPLIAVGGIDSAEEAYWRLSHGARLVQLYSALVYRGPGLARRINQALAALYARDGAPGG